jgi:hypothetical protein
VVRLACSTHQVRLCIARHSCWRFGYGVSHQTELVPPSMLKDNILDRGSYGHFFFFSRPSSHVAIESSTANVRQTAHPLDTQVTLQWHLSLYFFVDAPSPRLFLRGRRALTLCKARLKKSTSRVLFANSRLSLRICLRRISSRVR